MAVVDLYLATFLALLLGYVVYSIWSRLDGRLPVAGALVLLVVAAIADAMGDTVAANQVAVYVFFLLGAGVLLLFVEHLRRPRTGGGSSRPALGNPPAEPREGADEG
ncbi:MAG TPA: hypothetical protein VEY07_03940 [Thermoplasmata archaeon]|nr:hypothetical protein [Thermoplasmata archaeon]